MKPKNTEKIAHIIRIGVKFFSVSPLLTFISDLKSAKLKTNNMMPCATSPYIIPNINGKVKNITHVDRSHNMKEDIHFNQTSKGFIKRDLKAMLWPLPEFRLENIPLQRHLKLHRWLLLQYPVSLRHPCFKSICPISLIALFKYRYTVFNSAVFSWYLWMCMFSFQHMWKHLLQLAKHPIDIVWGKNLYFFGFNYRKLKRTSSTRRSKRWRRLYGVRNQQSIPDFQWKTGSGIASADITLPILSLMTTANSLFILTGLNVKHSLILYCIYSDIIISRPVWSFSISLWSRNGRLFIIFCMKKIATQRTRTNSRYWSSFSSYQFVVYFRFIYIPRKN